MELTIGFSTCPNDTFIFDAMVNGKIDTGKLRFNQKLADVEELNNRAFNGEYDITKISFHAFAYIAKQYLLLNSGSALGFNNGPLLVGRKNNEFSEVNNLRIGIPGRFTTANLLFKIAWPEANDVHEYLFSDIEDAVLNNEIDLGLIIHENRFTYEKKGLIKVQDLGEFWHGLTSMPIPLGGIAIRRDIPKDIAKEVDKLIYQSLKHSISNPDSPYQFMRRYAVTMEREVMNQHIGLYVNDFSLDLGVKGKKAINLLYSEATSRNIIPQSPSQIFVEI